MPCSPIGGFIVKKFFSLLIALVLLASMFALPTFALADESEPDADEAPARELALDPEAFIAAFAKYVIAENSDFNVEMSPKFQLNQTWLDDAEKVHELFGDGENGIHYILLPAEDDEVEDVDGNKFAVTYKAGAHAKLDEENNAPADVVEKVLKTKHVTLKSATTFEAAEGYVFAGWKTSVDYDGSDKDVLYRAGDKFAMPAHEVVVEAQWAEKPAEGEVEQPDYTYPVNDIICLEYCTPSDDPKDEHWSRVKATDTISVQTTGDWMFRYVVVDGEKGDVTEDENVITNYNTEAFKEALYDASTNTYAREKIALRRVAVDTSAPEIALSSSMRTKMVDGLKVGTSYSVPTSLDITDSSSTTVTYKVYRHSGNGAKTTTGIGEQWVLIYDSAADVKVQEGGESYITSSGSINPISSDVTSDGNYRYMIIYTVEDAYGYYAVKDASKTHGEFDLADDEYGYHPVLMLGVSLSDSGAKAKAKMEAWKIVLFVVAGLSAVGIVVLLVVKPKQATGDDPRVGSANVAAETTADAKASASATPEAAAEPVAEPVDEVAEESAPEEAPVEAVEAPAEEAPVEEAPAEAEAPVEEAPAEEEAPVEKPEGSDDAE